ncbi:hypothetical protein [Parvularcula sp. LCG005]|uniref:phosphatase domain-containing protein n=1 Tax=Parvularcula sp. LCG005 TaxID=3078805 RepID=UPI002941E0E5|nr:hypothetical protein [Parvularcula sp. LCG005]WOI54096.1 hypothetical protein RUI03_03620 [Parvularcula sp. LCG005]
MFVVFDLDGTLALVEHRRPLISGKKRDWNAFFRACVDDEPHEPVIRLAQTLSRLPGYRVEIWSGRSDLVRAETEAWLENVGLGSIPLTMRRDGDTTPDDVLKRGWLRACDQRPDIIFDDRDKVVAMWREEGIVCAQVAPGDF